MYYRIWHNKTPIPQVVQKWSKVKYWRRKIFQLLEFRSFQKQFYPLRSIHFAFHSLPVTPRCTIGHTPCGAPQHVPKMSLTFRKHKHNTISLDFSNIFYILGNKEFRYGYRQQPEWTRSDTWALAETMDRHHAGCHLTLLYAFNMTFV